MVCSARKGGNCEEIAERVLETLGEKGVETELVRLVDYDIKPCRRCDYECFREEFACPIRDDVPLIWGKLAEADGIIIATPTYYGFVPAILKAFIERAQGTLRWVTVELRDLEGVWRGKPTLVIVVSDGGGDMAADWLRGVLREASVRFWHVSYTKLGRPGHLGGLIDLPELSSRVKEESEELYRELMSRRGPQR